MNRYPLWKYIFIALALVIGMLYTAPNFYGESPAVQISSQKATVKVDEALFARVQQALNDAQLHPNGVFFEQGAQQNTIRVRFDPTQAEEQLQAKEVIDRVLNPDPSDPSYVVALNLVPNTPQWLLNLHALPMYLGLDLRGGVHFMLEVDMEAAVQKRIDAMAADLRSQFRDERIRHAGIARAGTSLDITFRSAKERDKARDLLRNTHTDLVLEDKDVQGQFHLLASMTPSSLQNVTEYALKQNISTLHNRINELGVAEPVIAQQGANRIVVQLPGVQDLSLIHI